MCLMFVRLGRVGSFELGEGGKVSASGVGGREWRRGGVFDGG